MTGRRSDGWPWARCGTGWFVGVVAVAGAGWLCEAGPQGADGGETGGGPPVVRTVVEKGPAGPGRSSNPLVRPGLGLGIGILLPGVMADPARPPAGAAAESGQEPSSVAGSVDTVP